MNFFKFLIPVLLVSCLSLNLLVPVHSDSYFFSLAVGEEVIKNSSFIFENIFTESGYKKSWASVSPLYDTFVYMIESQLGEAGIGLFQIIMFLFIGNLTLFLMLLYSSGFNNIKTNQRTSYVTLISLISIGTLLYGVSLDSILFFVSALLILNIQLFRKYNSIIFELAFFLVPLICFAMLDVRVVFVPLLSLGIQFMSNMRLGKYLTIKICSLQILMIALAFILPPLGRGLISATKSFFVEFYLSRLVYPEFYSDFTLFIGKYFDFSWAFFLLILILFFVKFYHTINNARFYYFITIFVFAVLSFISPVFLYSLVLAAGIFLSRDSKVIADNQLLPIARIENTIIKLGNHLDKLSYSGRVFVLLAFSFVQVISYLKYPVSDILMPVKTFDHFIEEDICPEKFPIYAGGYMAYRFQHDDTCLPRVSRYTLSTLSKEEIEVLYERPVRGR